MVAREHDDRDPYRRDCISKAGGTPSAILPSISPLNRLSASPSVASFLSVVGPARNMAEKAQAIDAQLEAARPEAEAAAPVTPEPQAVRADMPLLRIEGVAKKFGAFQAVNGVSVDIA